LLVGRAGENEAKLKIFEQLVECVLLNEAVGRRLPKVARVELDAVSNIKLQDKIAVVLDGYDGAVIGGGLQAMPCSLSRSCC
jgi:hypothetical protein